MPRVKSRCGRRRFRGCLSSNSRWHSVSTIRGTLLLIGRYRAWQSTFGWRRNIWCVSHAILTCSLVISIEWTFIHHKKHSFDTTQNYRNNKWISNRGHKPYNIIPQCLNKYSKEKRVNMKGYNSPSLFSMYYSFLISGKW
jgi:hypothetical protein